MAWKSDLTLGNTLVVCQTMSHFEQTSPFGLSCALALPLQPDSRIDFFRLSQHARRSLDSGCSSITVFGTTGEGASVSLSEREQILEVLSTAGISLRQQVLAGVAAASIGDAAQQARLLIERDCRGMLLAPPFYFKNVTDEGLYRWFSQLFDKIGSRLHDVLLYHIPSVTQAPLSVELIERLKTAFPGVITGVKDSGGDWTYTERLLRTDPDLIILIGDERHLVAGVRLGAQGAISGLANLFPERLSQLIESKKDDPQVVELVNEVLQFPVTPAVKALLAHRLNDPAWLTMRPPLVALTKQEVERLADAYRRLFEKKAA
jgi:4-hydroxy-tetrahydrodipicolinate synthase